MMTVPARHITYPRIAYEDGLHTAVGPKGTPQWTLERKEFLERGVQGLSRHVLVLIPKKADGTDYNDKTTEAFAKDCVGTLCEEIVKYGGLAAEKQLTRDDFHSNTLPYSIERDKDYGNDFLTIISNALSSSDQPRPTLAVLLSPSKSGTADLFADFKRIAERNHGMHTLCLSAEAAHAQAHVSNFLYYKQLEKEQGHLQTLHNRRLKVPRNPKQGARPGYDHLGLREARLDELPDLGPRFPKELNRLGQYMGNVSMKVNLKLDHTNHSVELPADVRDLLISKALPTSHDSPQEIIDTIILGADVTHPLKGSSKPSIAAIVGSVDKHLSRYLGSVRYQPGGKEVSIREQSLRML